MALTKNIRDGSLLIVSDLSDVQVTSLQSSSRVYQNGVWYVFYIALDTGVYYLRRQVSLNPLDGMSVTASNVLNMGTLAGRGIHVLRVSDSLWYATFSADASGGSAHDLYICSSTDHGATWSDPSKIIDNGASWCASYLQYPTLLIDTVGGYYYIYAVGDGDKIGAFRCLTSGDPLANGSWAACAANPLFDSPNAGLYRGRFVKHGDRIVYVGSAYLTSGLSSSPYLYAFAAPGFGQTFVTQNGIVTYDFGVTVANPSCTDVFLNPQDGLWYLLACCTGHYENAWCGKSPLSGMSRIPSAAPDYWPEGIATTVQFVDGGLSWTNDRDVREIKNRGRISHLRSGSPKLAGKFTFMAYDDLATLIDALHPTDTMRAGSEVALPAIMFIDHDTTDVPDQYIIVPDAEIQMDFAEGADGNKVTITFKSRAPSPCVGVMNSTAFTPETSVPGGKDPEEVIPMEEP